MFRESVVKLRQEKEIVYVILNRPKVYNALNVALLLELGDALDMLRKDETIKAVILTGSGDRAFSAGADIAYLNSATPLQIREFANLAVEVTTKLENLGKIVIAAINGYALGGGLELAEACMLRVAVKGTKLGHPEVAIGAVAGWGGTTRLPRLIGKGRAAEMLLTGDMITAEKALEIGLVNRVVESNTLNDATKNLAEKILKQAPLSVSLTWEAMHRGLNMTLAESTRLGADYFGLIASTQDFREGTKAFQNKTSPVFKGK